MSEGWTYMTESQKATRNNKAQGAYLICFTAILLIIGDVIPKTNQCTMPGGLIDIKT